MMQSLLWRVADFLRKATTAVLAIMLATWSLGLLCSSEAHASSATRVEDLDSEDATLDVPVENMYGATLEAEIYFTYKYQGPLTDEDLRAGCQFSWYDGATLVGSGPTLALTLNGGWHEMSLRCVATRNGVQEDLFVDYEVPEIRAIDLTAHEGGTLTIDQSSISAGETVSVSLEIDSYLTAISDQSEIFSMCDTVWYIDGIEYARGSSREFTVPNDESLYGKTITCSIESTDYSQSILTGSTTAVNSVLITAPVVPPTPTPTPTPEPTPTVDPTVPAEDSETERIAEETPTEPATEEPTSESAAAPAVESSASVEESQSDEALPIVPVVVGAAAVVVGGIAISVVALGGGSAAAGAAASAAGAAAIAASTATGTATGAASAAGAAGAAGAAESTSVATTAAEIATETTARTVGLTEAKLALRAARVATFRKSMKKQNIAFCANDLQNATAIAEDLDSRPLITVSETTVDELLDTLSNKKQAPKYQMAVLPLVDMAGVAQLKEHIAAIKNIAPNLKINVLAHVDAEDEALKNELEAMRASQEILCYASETSDGDTIFIRFILPLYKNVATGDDAIESVCIIASAFGIPDVSTALTAYSVESDIKEEVDNKKIDKKKTASNVYNIADIMGYNGVDKIVSFISSAL